MNGPQLTHTQKTRRLVGIGSLLLLALLGIVGAVLWNDASHETPLGQRQNDLQSIRIQRPDFPDMQLQVDAQGSWHITDPCPLPINTQRLQPLLDALAPAAMSYAAAEVDLETAGLLTPQAVIFMNDQKLALGITDLSGERRYLQRGERVEFVPEWVLSLVNGGLSALADLEVFPQGLDELTLSATGPEASTPTSMVSDELTHWQALTAQQIVTWPLQESDPETTVLELTAKTGSQELTLNLHVYPRYIALHYENAACAYLLPAAALSELILP